MKGLAEALIGAGLYASPSASPISSGWLLTALFGLPTLGLGFLAWRAQRNRDLHATELEQRQRDQEQETERRSADASQLAAQNERLRIIQEAQRQAMASLQDQLTARDETIAARDIEITRMHALEIDWHEREMDMRASVRQAEDERDQYRRLTVALREQITESGVQPRTDEGS